MKTKELIPFSIAIYLVFAAGVPVWAQVIGVIYLGAVFLGAMFGWHK